MKDRILSIEQAKAIYRAMCELNNVNAKIDVTIGNPDMGIHVYEYKYSDKIFVHKMNHGVVIGEEWFENQEAFHLHYDFD